MARPIAAAGTLGLFLVLIALAASAATFAQQADAHQWAAARFQGQPRASTPDPGLLVLANHDVVQKNARGGRPMKLAGADHSRGLYGHAPSRILVRLPGPGRTFAALVGVDSNEQTSGGRGSVCFAVLLGATEKFRSGVLREGQPPVSISLDLEGATEFTLVIDDGGDGIACDQADWAEARATLADGRDLWLADLPLAEDTRTRLFATDPPFSFTFGGKPSSEVLAGWESHRTQRPLDERRVEHALAWTDRTTGFELRCAAIEYLDFPTVEWTLHVTNAGTADTPMIENLQALDVHLDRGLRGEFRLHHAVGSPADGNDYGPREALLHPGTTLQLGAAGGRPTNKDWACFNLEWGGEGLITAVGWPGQWAAAFVRDAGRGLRLRAGQEATHFVLHPGEEIRTPLIVLQFWSGDWIGAQNQWRRWMMAHSMPRPGGRLPAPMLLASSGRQYAEMIRATEANQILFIDRYREEELPIDYWWMDAGWYVNQSGWPNVGTWEVDTGRFPRGLKAISDHARQFGIKTLVWFEPERVTAGTWLARTHPEWILGGERGGLLNLGDDAARQWLTDHVDRLLNEQGIDLYRQDFNLDPLESWRRNDAPDRQGLTEIRHVTGYLAYWDELRRRHPDMLIDTCASGGRRNDVETLRRAVPLWRSDYAYEPIGHQCMTYGLSFWVPFHGTGTVAASNAPYYGEGRTPVEPYAFWSNAAPSLGCGFDVRVKDLDYAALRRLIGQWRRTSANYYGDFYPLTPWTRDDTVWMAWQFDRPEAGEGMVQAFRRDRSVYETARFKLRGLDPAGGYEVGAIDAASPRTMTGTELLETGLPVAIADQPGVAVITYRKRR